MTIVDATSAGQLITAFTGVISSNIAGLLLIMGTMGAIAWVFRKVGKHSKGK